MWIRLLSVIFLILLLKAHTVGEFEIRLWLPLSLMRDGPTGWLGYAMFAFLVGISALQCIALTRAKREWDAGICWIGTVLLVFVALTPSVDFWHLFASVILLSLLYSYYAFSLRNAGSIWLIPHLVSPIILVLLTKYHSYGLWQKSLIVYLVLIANIHHWLLGRGYIKPIQERYRYRSQRRRKVYTLEPGPTWKRKRIDSRCTQTS
jgi:hypothetical protein